MTKAIVAEAEVIDHGIDHCQYSPGCGVAYTEFTNVATGCGDTASEALDDALDSLAQQGWEGLDENEDIAYALKDAARDRRSASGETQSAAEDENPPEFTTRFASYSGMADTDVFEDEESARDEMADLLRERRIQGFPCVILERGAKWEIKEREDAGMVGDRCGILTITDNAEEREEAIESANEMSECFYYVSVRVRAAE